MPKTVGRPSSSETTPGDSRPPVRRVVVRARLSVPAGAAGPAVAVAAPAATASAAVPAVTVAAAITPVPAVLARRAVAARVATFDWSQERLAGALHPVLVVDGDHLHLDPVADLDHVLDPADVAV